MTIYKTGPLTVPKLSAFTHCFPPSRADDDAPAFIDASTDQIMSRGQVKDQSLRFAYGLRHLSAFGRGRSLTEKDAFLLFSPNHLLYPVVTLSALASGVPVACASAAAVPAELAHYIKISKASFYVIHPALIKVFTEAMTLLSIHSSAYSKRTVLLFNPSKDNSGPFGTVSDLIHSASTMEAVRFDGDRAKTTAVYYFSSGTTGLPKAVEISHLNLVAQGEATRRTEILPQGEPAVLSTPLPLFHVAAGTHLVFFPLMIGYPSVISSTPFNMESYLAGLSKYKVTISIVAPPIIAGLTMHPAVAKADLRHLKRLGSGAAPISGHLLQKCHERLKNIAHPDLEVCSIYGMSETCSAVTQGVEAARKKKYDSLGPLIPGVEGRLVIDNERDAKSGEAGELWLRGDVIMNGYLRNPQATADTLTSDGWLKTGDVAVVDEDGFFMVVDRQKELIKYNGFQVPPAELEAVLGQHPAVADAGVIGILSPDGSTELPKAYISLRDPSQLGSKTLPLEIAEWFKGRVSHYKALRGGVVLINAVPRSAAGKILRRELRELEKKKPVQSRL